MSSLLKIYKKVSFIFIGEEACFSLQHRIFNLFSLFVCITTVFSFSFNLIFGLYESAVLTAVICLIQSILLYLSRVEKKFNFALIVTGIELHSLLIVNYFINGGVAGPTTILLLAILFLMISVVGLKNSWIWLSLNLIIIAGLFSTEYFYPNSIITGYNDRLFVFSDVFATYIMVVVLMATGILYKRRAYEKQRRSLESKAVMLEKLNSEKNKLFSIISHDLRAPVGSVKQYLSFLKENDLTAEEKAIIEKGLVKSTNEAYELLDNLLVWAKSQLGGAKPFLTQLNPSKFLADVIQKAKDYAKEKDVTITEEIDNIEIFGDENMLQIVVRNLLFNAVKFSESNGNVVLSIYEQNNHAIIMVKDNGVGISYENQKRIFSLDVKSNIGTKKEKGSGLGLVLCKEYTQLQNGTIYFESNPGQGTSFFVSLPIRN